MKPSWSQTRLPECGGAVLPAKKSIAHYSVSVGGGFNSLFIPPRRSASPCTREGPSGGAKLRSERRLCVKEDQNAVTGGCGRVIDEAC